MKRILPDAHTDFIFAVTGEEFGVIVCLLLVLLFAVFVLRAFLVAQANEDPFCRLAVTGLAMLFGLQACINMAVNVHLMPAKGMTLPFVSYGGRRCWRWRCRGLPRGVDPQAATGRKCSIAASMRSMMRAAIIVASRPRTGEGQAGMSAPSRICWPPAEPAGICSRPRR